MNFTRWGTSQILPPTYNPYQTSVSWKSQTTLEQGNSLSFGIGKLARHAFDQMKKGWHNIWEPRATATDITYKSKRIIQDRLAAFSQRLEANLVNLRKNPNDSYTLKQLESLISEHSEFFNSDQKGWQKHLKLFNPLIKSLNASTQAKLKPLLFNFFEIDEAFNKTLAPKAFSEKNGSLKRNALEASCPQPKVSINLDALQPSQGFIINNSTLINPVGDLNKDGIADFVIQNTPATTTLIWGNKNLSTTNLSNSIIDNSLKIDGFVNPRASNLGDFNADGYADIAIIYTNYLIYVLFGPFQNSIDVKNLNGSNGFILFVTYPGLVVGGKDINGDGIPDLLVSETKNNQFYGIFGKSNPWPAQFNVTQINGENGFIGKSTSTSVQSMAMGFFNQDAIADFAIGYTKTIDAKLTVFYGHKNPWNKYINLDDSLGSSGFQFNGLKQEAILSLNIDGDFNKDGLVDLIAATPLTNKVYILYKHPNSGEIGYLETLSGQDGLILKTPIVPRAPSGLGLTIVVIDFNNDGNSDLVLGGPGGIMLIWGQEKGLPTEITFNPLNDSLGFTLGASNLSSTINYKAFNLQDINGDGLHDLGISVSNRAYVLFGQKATPCLSPTSIPSTPSPTPLAPLPSIPPSPPPLIPSPTVPTSDSPAILPSPTSNSPIPAEEPPLPSSPISPTINPTSNENFPPTEVLSPIPTPIPLFYNSTSPTSESPTWAIIFGSSSVAILAGITGAILILKYKKKACFADDATPIFAGRRDRLFSEIV